MNPQPNDDPARPRPGAADAATSAGSGAPAPDQAATPDAGPPADFDCTASIPRTDIDPQATRYPGTPTDPLATTYPATGAGAGDRPAVPPALAGYEILEELGRGGMGVVYKARQRGLGRVVALKMILAGAHAGSDDVARFRREAEAIAQLQHPNIVQVHEVGEAAGLPYFSLEFCPGGSLEKKLQGTPLPAREAARLIEMLAEAVQAAHAKGLVHRDLKPANVLLAEDGTPKITDFGLAKRLDLPGQTASGAVVGTPSYMAPEQAAGRSREIGPATDVYALGAILYECLTGRPPFRSATTLDTLLLVTSEEPVPPSRLQPGLPRDLETICLKCLRKEPAKRYATAAALAGDLKCFLDGEPIQARRVRLWERTARWIRRRPAAAALAGILLALALALPVAGVQFSVQLAQQQAAEQKRLDEARAAVGDLLARGQTAADSNDWPQAELLLDEALQKSQAEPALAELREKVEAARAPVKDRLRAIATYRRFTRDRDETLFHATLATGDDLETHRKAAQEKAWAALAAVGLSPEGQEALTLAPSFTKEEGADIRAGSCLLLLVLAESAVPRRLPDQAAAPRLRQALALLDRAERLGVQTRAIHLRRARYRTLLGDVAGAATETELARAPAAQTDLGVQVQDHFLVGQELYSQGQLEQAEQEFGRALQLDGRHFWSHYFVGICCVKAGKLGEAVAHFTICQSQQQRLVWIYLLRGFALGQMKEYAAAEEDFDRALPLASSDTAAQYVLYNNRGVMRIGQEGAWAKGVDDLKAAAAVRPNHYRARASLAEAYRMKDRLDDAGRELDQAIALAGRQVQAGDLGPVTLALLYHSRAQLHLQRSDREARYPPLGQPWFLAAQLLLQRSDREAAVRDLVEAARLAENDPPERAKANADRGQVLHLQGRLDEALAAYNAALKADPQRVDVLRRRGEVLLAQHHYEEAAAAFDSYLGKVRGAPPAAVYRQRGLARAKLGQHAEAILDYTRALEAKPKDEEKPRLYLDRGQEYLASNALQPALRDFQEALRLDPSSADAALGSAHVRVKLGGDELARGLDDAERAVKDNPKEPHLWHGAARIYAQAAAQVKAEPGMEQSQAWIRSLYQERAVALLAGALNREPAGQRQAYWRENVRTDKALYPLWGHPEFARLAARYEDQDR